MTRSSEKGPPRADDELWRQKAREMLPELDCALAEADEAMAFWVEVETSFAMAYDEPRDEDFIRRVYEYALWSIEEAPRSTDAGSDPFTCVVVCLYESIPAIPAARADMPRWFSLEEVQQNREVFSYHLQEGEFEQILALYGGQPERRVNNREDKRKARRD